MSESRQVEEPGLIVAPPAGIQREALRVRLVRLDRLARLMDEQFELPLVRKRIGLDPILGLIPGGGDWAAWLVGVYIFWQAIRLDVPRRMMGRMAVNLTIDLVAGMVPAAGDVFDALFKANRKNVDLLLGHYQVRREHGKLWLADELPPALKSARTTPRWQRYALGILITLLLFALASLPLLLIWWWLHGSAKP